MLIDDLKEKIEVLPKDEANILRDLYIENFIDTNKEGYKNNILERKRFSDGFCYTGYLWDYITKHQKVSIQSIINDLTNKKMVLVMWDIHSCDRIYIKDYWKFGKDNIVKIDAEYLIEGLDYFPDDIYIFDYDLKWTYIRLFGGWSNVYKKVNSNIICRLDGKISTDDGYTPFSHNDYNLEWSIDSVKITYGFGDKNVQKSEVISLK